MAVALEIRIGNLILKLLAHTFGCLCAFSAAGTVSAGALESFSDGIDDLLIGIELDFHVRHRWTTAYRLGDEAAQQAAAYLTVQAPELNFASVYGAKGNTVEIDLCYTEQDGMTPANYVDDLPLDAAFDKALLQKVPSRLCAQVLCDGKPTEADMQTVLHTLKQVLESNDMPITYYDITLVPTGDYADHSAFMTDVLESGLTSADTIA